MLDILPELPIEPVLEEAPTEAVSGPVTIPLLAPSPPPCVIAAPPKVFPSAAPPKVFPSAAPPKVFPSAAPPKVFPSARVLDPEERPAYAPARFPALVVDASATEVPAAVPGSCAELTPVVDLELAPTAVISPVEGPKLTLDAENELDVDIIISFSCFMSQDHLAPSTHRTYK